VQVSPNYNGRVNSSQGCWEANDLCQENKGNCWWAIPMSYVRKIVRIPLANRTLCSLYWSVDNGGFRVL